VPTPPLFNENKFQQMPSSQFAPTPAQIECIRNIFHAIAAASGDKKHLKSKDLGDLCSALNDPIESEELPKVTKMLSDDNGLITFDKFLDFWSTEEEL
jgi:Ca2+-binding EF-hand superfamily protein